MSVSLENIVEAIIFTSDQPIKCNEICEAIEKSTENTISVVSQEKIKHILNELTHKYAPINYPFEIKRIGGGYQFFTKEPLFPFIRQAVLSKNQKKLSKSAIEVLSVVAYRQPITKTEVEHIRGVNSDYAIHKLLDKKLITVSGRLDAPGKPLLYSTTPYFLQYLGINQLDDLPKLKEFEATPEDNAVQFINNL